MSTEPTLNAAPVHPVSYPSFNGMRIVVSELMADRVQFRFPRSKKKRMRKKWAKNPENWKYVPWDRAYRVGDTLHMHPQMFERLRRSVSG
jgi:hypothetical protein